MAASKWIPIVGAVATMAVMLAIFGCSNSDDSTVSPRSSAGTSSQNSQVSTLDKIAVVFKGDFSKAEIKSKLDQAMRLYGVPITDENYNRTSSALLVSRKAAEQEGCNDCTEMLILDYMIRSYVPGVDIPFADMVGISKAALVAGDR